MAEVPRKVDARTLTEKIWGSDFIASIPEGWRTALKYLRLKTPGVNNDTNPDTLTQTLVTSQVTTNRINELEKETVMLDAPLSDEIEHEQDYDAQFDVVVPKIKYLTPDNAEVGLPRRDIRAFNPKVSEVTTFDPSQLTAVFDTYVLSFPGTTNLQLPDVLEAVDCSMEKSSADGVWDEDGGAFWFGAGSAAISFGGSADSAAVIMPALSIRIRQPFAHNIPTQHHLFFMKLPVTTATVVAKLSTLLGVPVLAWPKFKPRSETIQLIGQERRLSVRVSSHWQDGGGCTTECNEDGAVIGTGEHSQGSGSGSSNSLGITIRTVTVPPTIHGNIALTGLLADSISGTATANIGGSSIVAVFRTDTITAEASVDTHTPVAGILPPTDDDFAIPTSGLRILNIAAEPYRFGYAKIHTEVVDFATL
jgi:hypothetical protein